MKLLVDACVAKAAVEFLRSAGHDVLWITESGADPGDEQILAQAHTEGRVLVTIDKDFGELAVVHRRPHSGIVRLVDLASNTQGPHCAAVLARLADDLSRGALATVERDRIRVRPPDE